MIPSKIAVIEGDITQQRVDAIVNAANTSLLGGGGVDGAIHQAAGPGLLDECRQLKGCKTGDAKITRGYNLSADWVIHTVGPVWQDGKHNEDELLASCYRRCLELAEQYEIRTIAFPAISTGVYRFPLQRAARIAVSEVKTFLEGHQSVELVNFVCFNRQSYNCYLAALKEILLAQDKERWNLFILGFGVIFARNSLFIVAGTSDLFLLLIASKDNFKSTIISLYNKIGFIPLTVLSIN
ncbi:MAG TPA: O-acetyl-ADP-ribose deacetylase [Allocoleopsis sp.]